MQSVSDVPRPENVQNNEDEADIIEILRNDDDSALEDFCNLLYSVDYKITRPKKQDKFRTLPNKELFLCEPSLLCGACFFRSFKCVNFLISQGADVYYEDRKKRTPFLYAIAGGSLPITQLIIENGADIHAVDDDGNGAVHYAVKYNQRALILWLCYGLGMSLSEANNKHETPLHTAASEMKLEVVKILCTHGADVNVRTSKGATPLHYAACKPCVEIIDVFYKNGADLSAKDNGGMQPYHWAKSMNRTEIQRFLIDHGAKVRDY